MALKEVGALGVGALGVGSLGVGAPKEVVVHCLLKEVVDLCLQEAVGLQEEGGLEEGQVEANKVICWKEVVVSHEVAFWEEDLALGEVDKGIEEGVSTGDAIQLWNFHCPFNTSFSYQILNQIKTILSCIYL